mmetsp:Transcript_32017/g.52906  ORF Transcript_32017/g.52906 Transcript_32017/m.52906 type:complete len:330 (+) Transcript_32017:192-1181(+)|eukprot:CAMPEP_0119004472 /NCGR_PEP_ID=MMETSP1176-20130426/1158_1 /TAXON_ID=265551 /ORGANISM="Synedropsis recta cf, Strain CCMP1620" /LENGTH=329 /DNA_ID=CAMNT_0006956175 /DNA_START=145 /DNA_END=1134 /DNA_ORIENTATION=+
MKITSSLILLATLATARAFVPTSVVVGPRPRLLATTTDTSHSSAGLQSKASNNNEDATASSRRRFLSQVTAAFVVVAAPSQPALAANKKQKMMDDLSKVTNSANKRIGGLSNKIRNIAGVMDELQRDLMQERWELVEAYPTQLRSFVPLLTTYTDSAFPTEVPTDKGLRVALRYEVGRYFASLERLKQATKRRSLQEAYVAYSDMSLHFDRYMRVGGIYTYYDDTISLEPYFKGIAEDTLVYSNPMKDPAEVRDLIILTKGPDKGKTGILIGIYPDGNTNFVVKLDRYKGMREIRVVQKGWVAKRVGEQDPDDVFLIPPTGGSSSQRKL